MVVIEDDCEGRDGDIAIVDECLRDVGDPPARGELLLGEDCLLGEVEQEEAAALVAGEQVVVVLGEGAEAGHILHVNRVLREILPHRPLVVPVLLLLLDLVHAQTQPKEDRLPQHLADQPVRLREEVLAVVGVADAPFVQIKLAHGLKLYYTGNKAVVSLLVKTWG